MVRIYTVGRRSGSPLDRYLVLATSVPGRRAGYNATTKTFRTPNSALLDFTRPLNGMVPVWLESCTRWGEYGPDHVVAMVTLGEFR